MKTKISFIRIKLFLKINNVLNSEDLGTPFKRTSSILFSTFFIRQNLDVEPVLPDHYCQGFRELELLEARDFNTKKDWAIYYRCGFYSF